MLKSKVISVALLISQSLDPPHLDFNQQTKLLITEACCTIGYPIQTGWVFAGHTVIQVTQVGENIIGHTFESTSSCWAFTNMTSITFQQLVKQLEPHMAAVHLQMKPFALQ